MAKVLDRAGKRGPGRRIGTASLSRKHGEADYSEGRTGVSEAARTAGTEGLVVLDAVIAPNGSVERLRPVSGADLLVQSAADAVQSWKFEPYLSGGRAVEVETTIAVEFRLN